MANFWDDIVNWFNPPQASAMLTPGTEEKAAKYFTQTASPNMALLPQTTPYTQALVKQYSQPAAITPSMGKTTGFTAPATTTATNPYDAILAEYGGGGDMGQLYEWQQITPWQQAQMDWEKQKYEQQKSQSAAELAAQQAYQQQQLAYQQQQAQQTAAYQQQQLAWQQQQAADQLAAEKEQRLATLAAQPKSWLEYAALSNQAPVVQPWMLPLMPQDYQKTQAVGNPIAGWTPENMKGMPDLINPSAQLMARMGPTAQQQYYGYQQADKGATPEETEWRLWSQGPTAGRNTGLIQRR